MAIFACCKLLYLQHANLLYQICYARLAIFKILLTSSNSLYSVFYEKKSDTVRNGSHVGRGVGFGAALAAQRGDIE